MSGPNAERNSEIVARRHAGEYYRDLARAFGISPSRVRQIVLVYERRERAAALPERDLGHPQWGLSVRSMNVLRNEGMETIDDLIEKARPFKDLFFERALLRAPNCGRKSIGEIMALLRRLT